MAEANVGALLVEIKADIKNLQAGLKTAQDSVKKSGGTMSTSFKQIGKDLAGAFALVKIASFVKGSIEEFAKVDRSLRLLGQTVRRTGGDWASLEKSAKSYIDTMEMATRFQDTEIADSLSKITTKVKDFSQATLLNKSAMDLAVAGQMDLSSASDVVANAYLGNTRGLSMLAKSLGVTGDKAKDATYLFAELKRTMGGAAESEQGAARDLDRLNKEIDNFKEQVGEALMPAVKDAISGFEQMLTWTQKAARGVGDFFDNFSKKSDPAKIQKRIDDINRSIIKSERVKAEFIAKAGTDERNGYLLQARAARTEATNRAAYIVQLKAEKQTLLELSRTRDQVSESKRRNDKLEIQSTQERTEEEKALEKEVTEIVKSEDEQRRESSLLYAETISGVFQSTAAEMVRAYQEGTLSVAKAFEYLSKAIFKALVKAVGQALVQEGASYIAKGIAAALGIITAPAAPGFFAAGGSLAAAGGAMIGIAEAALAEGGIVTQPTLALIGEAGPEKVIPLSKDNMSGNITISAPISLPNVQNPRDFETAEGRRSTERWLAGIADKMQRMKGLRLQPGIA